MQFVIGRNALQKELAFVQGVVERKNTIPVLANILIESAGEDSIRISGTDLDVTIRCDADAQEIKSQGAICVQARKLFDIARLLPDAPVKFRKEENEWVTVECDRSKFRLPGISKETFPELPGKRNLDRSHSTVTHSFSSFRNFTGASGRSLAMSKSFRAWTQMAP